MNQGGKKKNGRNNFCGRSNAVSYTHLDVYKRQEYDL